MIIYIYRIMYMNKNNLKFFVRNNLIINYHRIWNKRLFTADSISIYGKKATNFSEIYFSKMKINFIVKNW